MTAVLAAMPQVGDDITPAAFSSIAASYSGNNSITTDTQTVSGISVPILVRAFWSMSGNVQVYVNVNGVEVTSTGSSALTSGSLDFVLHSGDYFSIDIVRNANRTGYLQLLNLTDGYKQLAYTGVTIT